MTRTPAALLAVLAACGSKKEEPRPARADAAAGAARATADATATRPGPVTDAAAATAAPVDAIAPTGPAPAGAFYLVDDELPLDAVLAIGPLDGDPAVASGGVIHADAGRSVYTVARELVAPLGPYAGLPGKQVALHTVDEEVCEATIDKLVAVKSKWGPPPATAEEAWTAKDTSTEMYVAATIAEHGMLDTPICEGAIFAVPLGEKVARVKLKKADDWGALEDLVAEHGDAERAREAAELNGEPEHPLQFLSERKLVAREGPSLGLVYLTIRANEEERTIAVASVPDGDPSQAEFLTSLPAPAPSVVVGVDADHDNVLDVVIGHDDGVAVVFGAGGGWSVRGGWWEDLDEQ